MSIQLCMVIPTRNESANIVECMTAFLPAVREGWGELIVIDNASTDDTQVLAHRVAESLPESVRPNVRIVEKGPERSAQRNAGWQLARAEYVFFSDADMRLPEATLREIQQKISDDNKPDALYVREVRTGRGWWTKVRNFERSFYDATCVDALRVIRRSLLEQTGGYDEQMHACEDWDLDRRLLQLTTNVALTDGHLIHDERRLTLGKHIKKKAYYSKNFSLYLDKWGRDETFRKQFGLGYRFFGIFVENGKWKRMLRHPLLMLVIWAERFCVGLVYLLRHNR